jgi:hypothetical protein
MGYYDTVQGRQQYPLKFRCTISKITIWGFYLLTVHQCLFSEERYDSVSLLNFPWNFNTISLLPSLILGCSLKYYPGNSVRDLLWTKWHWDRFFSESFGFPLSLSFYRCSIFTHVSSGGWTMDPLEAHGRLQVPATKVTLNVCLERHKPLWRCIYHYGQWKYNYLQNKDHKLRGEETLPVAPNVLNISIISVLVTVCEWQKQLAINFKIGSLISKSIICKQQNFIVPNGR